MNQNCDIETCPCKNQTYNCSIFSAASTNSIQLIKNKLLINPNIAGKLDVYGYTPLHYSAQMNNFTILSLLLSSSLRKVDPDFNTCGATPLHRAAYSGAYECCEILLKAGAYVDAIDTSFKDHQTPLHKAASRRHRRVVDLLLSYHADTTILDAHGQLAMDLLSTQHEIVHADAAATGSSFIPNNDTTDTGYDDIAFSTRDCSDNINNTASTKVRDTGTSTSLCSKCGQTSLSFARTADGLICMKCKYRVY